jgi:hypothetical protein
LARILALDWDHQQLHVVSATVGRHGVQIRQAVAWAEEKSPNPADAEELGRLLRERLKAAGIAAAPVLVCVGRDRLILKDVRYPAVPEAEEPAVIRFQAVKELTDPAEEAVIDYTASAEATANGERRALALIIRRELLNTYQSLCKAAGLKLLAVTPRPLCAAACFEHLTAKAKQAPLPEPPGATVAVLTVTERWAEFCVLRGGQLLLARSLGVGSTLAGEVRRNVSVYAGQAPSQPVRALYVAGNGDEAELRARLQELLRLPVHSLDSFAGQSGWPGLSLRSPGAQPQTGASEDSSPGHPARGGFVAPVGLLHAWAIRKPLPINFVAPKQPKPPRDPNRKRILAGAAAAAILLVCTVAYCYSKLDARDRRIEELSSLRNELDTRLVQIEEDAKRIGALDEWSQREIVWLDELYDLTERFPDTNAIRLTLLDGAAQTPTGKDRHVARMTLTGITTEDHSAVDTLMSKLEEDRDYYNVDAKQTSPNRSIDFFRFRRKFVTHVDMEKRPPDKYVRRLLPPSAEESGGRSRRGQGGDGGADFFGGPP